MKIHTSVENGKAYLEFEFSKEDSQSEEIQAVFLQIHNQEKKEVLRMLYPLSEEEPAKGILLHPHLWNGTRDPYLYRATASFTNKCGDIKYSKQQFFPLRTFEEILGKGWFLNGKPLEIRAVQWDSEGIPTEQEISKTLEQLLNMGANTLYLKKENATESFLQLCEEKGFLVQWEEEAPALDANAPHCNELFLQNYPHFTDTYYFYKAKWSPEPFVYISLKSIQKTERGTYSLTVYSNQKKAALYVDGILFEFLTGGQEYHFEEITVKKYPAVLTAEAGECSTAVTLYEGSHNFHKTITFS